MPARVSNILLLFDIDKKEQRENGTKIIEAFFSILHVTIVRKGTTVPWLDFDEAIIQLTAFNTD